VRRGDGGPLGRAIRGAQRAESVEHVSADHRRLANDDVEPPRGLPLDPEGDGTPLVRAARVPKRGGLGDQSTVDWSPRVDQPFSPLVAEILTAQRTQTAAVTEQVMANYRRDLAYERARRQAVQNAVLALLAGPWLPHPDAIAAALFPSDELIATYRKDNDG